MLACVSSQAVISCYVGEDALGLGIAWMFEKGGQFAVGSTPPYLWMRKI